MHDLAIHVPSVKHALGSLIPVQVLQYTTWWVCADIQPGTFTPSNVGGDGGRSMCVMYMWVRRQDSRNFRCTSNYL